MKAISWREVVVMKSLCIYSWYVLSLVTRRVLVTNDLINNGKSAYASHLLMQDCFSHCSFLYHVSQISSQGKYKRGMGTCLMKLNKIVRHKNEDQAHNR